MVHVPTHVHSSATFVAARERPTSLFTRLQRQAMLVGKLFIILAGRLNADELTQGPASPHVEAARATAFLTLLLPHQMVVFKDMAPA